MGIIQRGNKYYVQCTDGEHELTEEEFQKLQSDTEAALDYIDQWRDKYSHQKWTTLNYPREADMYLQMDHHFKLMGESLSKLFNEHIKTQGIDEIERIILLMINQQEIVYKENAINKLSKYYKPSKYSLKHLAVIKERMLSEMNAVRAFTKKNDVEKKPELTVMALALKLFYEGIRVTRKNAEEITKSYGHKSGDHLYIKCTHYKSRTNRIGINDASIQEAKNRADCIEYVIQLLTGEAKKTAESELATLRAAIKKGI